MNRRSFIAGILAACVAPAILVPKCPDHSRWRYRRQRGLFIAEFKYACFVPNFPVLQDCMFLVREPENRMEVNPEWINAQYSLPAIAIEREYAGKWEFVEWHGPPSYVPAQT